MIFNNNLIIIYLKFLKYYLINVNETYMFIFPFSLNIFYFNLNLKFYDIYKIIHVIISFVF